MAPRKSITKDTRKVVRATKQVKSQAKQVKKTTKSIGKAFKGIKKALKKKQSKKATKKSIPKPTPIVKRSQLPSIIKLKNIKQFQGKDWASIVNDRELLAKLDKLKKPGDYFIGSVFGANTHKFFRTGAEVIDQLNQYVDSYRGDEQKMIDTFTIATMQGQPTDYARQVDERIKENKRVALEERSQAGEIFGKTNAKGKTKTFRDFFKDAVNLASEQQQKIDALTKRLDALEKAARKGAKKNATKRSTNNQGSRSTARAKAKSTKPVSTKRGSTKTSGKGKAKTATKAKPKTGAAKRTNKSVGKKAAKKTNNRRK